MSRKHTVSALYRHIIRIERTSRLILSQILILRQSIDRSKEIDHLILKLRSAAQRMEKMNAGNVLGQSSKLHGGGDEH